MYQEMSVVRVNEMTLSRAEDVDVDSTDSKSIYSNGHSIFPHTKENEVNGPQNSALKIDKCLPLPTFYPPSPIKGYRTRAKAKARMLEPTTGFPSTTPMNMLEYASRVLLCSSQLSNLGAQLLQALMLNRKDQVVEICKQGNTQLRELSNLNLSMFASVGLLSTKAMPEEDEILQESKPDMELESSEHCIIIGYPSFGITACGK